MKMIQYLSECEKCKINSNVNSKREQENIQSE